MLARAYLTTLMVSPLASNVEASTCVGYSYLHLFCSQAYVLRPGSEWYFCFYSALTRKKALKVLKSLKLPVGAPDRDERDGSVGLFAKVKAELVAIELFTELTASCTRQEDLGGGWDTGELETKDLEALWSILGRSSPLSQHALRSSTARSTPADKYEGYRWGPESTLVITDNPKHMLAQPFNFILAPSFNYRSNVRIAEDQFLLMIITCLRDLVSNSSKA